MSSAIKITDKEARAAQADPVKAAKGLDSFVWDKSLKGFGIKLAPGGGKSFIYAYRVPHTGKTRRLTLGSVEKTSASAARDKAEIAKTAVRNGQDPAAEKSEARKAQTVRDLATEWLALLRLRAERGEMSLGTVEDYRRKLTNHILPAFGSAKPTELTSSKIRAWRDQTLARAAKAESPRQLGPEGMKAVLRVLSAVLGYLVEREIIKANPAAGLKQFSTRKRERFLTEEEVARLGNALAQRHDSAPHWVAAIELMLLTGMRKTEVLSLRWDAIRAEEGVILLTSHKTARKSGAKRIALSGAVSEILSRCEASRRPGSPYVFPSVTHKNIALIKSGKAPRLADLNGHMSAGGLKRFWGGVRKAAGLDGDDPLRVHDLRHSWASTAASSGVSLAIIGRHLGHTNPVTTARYSHIADRAAAEVAEQVSATLRERMDRGRTAQVVHLKRHEK